MALINFCLQSSNFLSVFTFGCKHCYDILNLTHQNVELLVFLNATLYGAMRAQCHGFRIPVFCLHYESVYDPKI